MLYASSKKLFSTNALRQYPFLKTLGLSEMNAGVYRGGQWVEGRGDLQASTNPHDNQMIAQTKLGNAEDFNDCIEAMKSE